MLLGGVRHLDLLLVRSDELRSAWWSFCRLPSECDKGLRTGPGATDLRLDPLRFLHLVNFELDYNEVDLAAH